jgi:hypothetical protein
MTATGAHDFDFVYGTWTVHNTKLRDNADPTCDEWVEFEAASEVFPILHGYGHIDRMVVPDPPDGEPFEGFTLRLFDPATERWSIWWSSTRTPGKLDVPVEGAFDGTHGTFECDDVIGGRDVRVRFEWRSDDPLAPEWRQSFSDDGGTSWSTNWIMRFTPAS